MTLTSRVLAAVALLVGAAVAPAVVTAPAHAAGCSGSTGLSVVVDFAELGGGVTAGCAGVPDGTRANTALQQAGYALTMVTKSPGFLCRVNGVPAADPCVTTAPADAYWSVWWSDGDGGSWVYSARGIDSLRVPDGGYLALSWHQGSGRSQPPATVPVSRKATAEPAPTRKPTKKAASKPAASATSKATPKPKATVAAPQPQQGAGTVTPSPSPSATASASASPSADASSSAEPTVDPSASGTPSPGESVAVDPDLPSAADITDGPETVAVDPSGASDDSLPVWVPILVVALVVGVGGGLAVARRRNG